MRSQAERPCARAGLRRPEAGRARGGARQPAAPAADGRADRRHGARGARRADGARRRRSRAARSSRCCSPSTTWTWCSATPTASSCSTRARSSPRARPTRCAPTRRCARCTLAMLEVRALSAGYGRAQVLFDLELAVAHGRGGGAARPQRRRQVHHAEGDHGPGARRAAARLSSTARASTRLAPLRDRPPRPGLCARGPAHLHRPHRGREPGGGPPAAARRRRRPGRWSGCSSLFPALDRCSAGAAARMSGGEQQMLCIARTLAGNPRGDPARRALGRAGAGGRRPGRAPRSWS